jgi:endonuclease/exonuclease/phosphatase (EEP) superfamily protein YafD
MPGRRKINIALWGLATGLALVTLAGFLGGVFPWMDAFSHLRVQYAIAAATLVGGGLWTGPKRLVPVAAALMAVNLITVAPYLSFSPAEAATSGLKIVSVNLLAHNQRTGEVLDFLRREDADIIVLQENTPHWVRALETLKDVYPHQISQTECQKMQLCQVMMLSKNPWSEARASLIDDTGAAFVWAKFPDLGLTVATTHLNRPFWTRGVAQSVQIEALAKRVRQLDGPLLLAGDFNATPWSAAYARLIEVAGIRRAGRGLNVTWPAWLWPFSGIPIDHVFTKGMTGSIDVRTGSANGSDHRALIATLAPAAKKVAMIVNPLNRPK